MTKETNLFAVHCDSYDFPIGPTRRGEANRLRKGLSKIHRRYVPEFHGAVPRGAAGKVVGRLRSHDWCRNSELIELRRKGYTPIRKRKDSAFTPKPLRITPRSESRQALTALSLALAANCNYDPHAEYVFEIFCPLESLAKSMGVLHVYDDGRKSYDILLNALSVLEQLNYCVLHRDFDRDAGQNKPVRMWLTPEFFMSRGFNIDEIREMMHKYRLWAVKEGLVESLKTKYERHLLRMAKMGIDIENRHSLKNLLKKIRREVVSPELIDEKIATVTDLGRSLERSKEIRAQNKENDKRPFWRLYVDFKSKQPIAVTHPLESALKKEMPHLAIDDPEAYYKLLLQRAGVL